MKFNKNRISHGTEGSAPKRKKVAISKKIYFTMLWSIFAYILYIFYLDTSIIKGTGIIKNDIYTFKAENDITITDINITEEKIIPVNTYLYTKKYLNKFYKNSNNDLNKIKYKKDLINLKLKIEEYNDMLKYNSSKNKDLLYTLDLYNKKDLKKEKDYLNEIKLKLKSLKKEYKLLNKEYKLISKIKNINNNKYLFKKEYMKINGKIIDLKIKKYMFFNKGTILYKVMTNKIGYIEGFFEKSKIKDIYIGKKINILLPNEEKISGHIVKMKSSFKEGKEKLSESYIPNSRSLKVFIELDNKNDDKILKRYNDLSVKLEINKW